MKSVLFVLALFVAAPLAAQTVAVNPTSVEFDPSPDHTATKIDNAGVVVDVVSRYDLSWVAQNAAGAVAFTKQGTVPKPNAGANGKITVAMPEFATLTPNVVFKAKVIAVGPDGSTPSLDSNPFGRPGPSKVPAAPGVPVAK